MSGEANKKPKLKNQSLFNTTTHFKKNVYQQGESISLNNLTLIPKKNIKLKPSKKIINVVDFIKQKKKFYIEDSFDIKGAREFLASKEVAMRVIKLNDEIDIDNKNQKEHSITNKNLINLGLNSAVDDFKKLKSSKIARKKTISPRKSRKKVKKMHLEDEENKVKSPKKRKEKISDNSSYMGSNGEPTGGKKSKDISNEEDIYKFIIDNESEPDDNFQQKLEKEIRKVESLKKTKKKKDKNVEISRKSQSRKELQLKRPKRMQSVVPRSKDSQSQFMFSEINKNMMKNDDINISSIGEDEKCCLSPKKAKKKKVKRVFGSIQINNQQLKERILQNMDKKIDDKDNKDFNENEKENKDGKIEIKSDKESLISILSDLM